MSEDSQSSLGSALTSPRANLKRVKIYKCLVCKRSKPEYDMMPGLKCCSNQCQYRYEMTLSAQIVMTNRMQQNIKLENKRKKEKKKKNKNFNSKNCVNCSQKVPLDRGKSNYCSSNCREDFANKGLKVERRQFHKFVKIDLWSPENKERWAKLRYETFKLHGRKCLVCGSTDQLNVDHIKPKSKYPELCWDINNLQILCEQCNIGKGYEHEDDWRTHK